MKILSAYNYLLLLLVLLGLSCSRQQYVHVADIDGDYIRVNKWAAKDDAEVKKLIEPYKKELDDKMDEVIGELANDMVKAKPSSSLGNWFTDYLMLSAKRAGFEDVDFAFQNYGGLRVNTVTAGPLTVREIFEIMPFENELVVMEMDAALVQHLLDRFASKGEVQISNELRVTFDNGKAKDIMINGEPLQSDRIYKVVLNDYVANGGDDCHFLKAKPRKEANKAMRDLIIEEVRLTKGIITADETPRIKKI